MLTWPGQPSLAALGPSPLGTSECPSSRSSSTIRYDGSGNETDKSNSDAELTEVIRRWRAGKRQHLRGINSSITSNEPAFVDTVTVLFFRKYVVLKSRPSGVELSAFTGSRSSGQSSKIKVNQHKGVTTVDAAISKFCVTLLQPISVERVPVL